MGDNRKVGLLVLLQRLPEPEEGKNRVHIDVYSDDIESERLVGFGAKRVSSPNDVHDARWVVMKDLGGNEFCVCVGPP
jgi:hypothetical protein